jgi:hypothetical protein
MPSASSRIFLSTLRAPSGFVVISLLSGLAGPG